MPYLTLTKPVWSQHPSPTGGSTGDRLLRPTGITPARALFMDTLKTLKRGRAKNLHLGAKGKHPIGHSDNVFKLQDKSLARETQRADRQTRTAEGTPTWMMRRRIIVPSPPPIASAPANPSTYPRGPGVVTARASAGKAQGAVCRAH